MTVGAAAIGAAAIGAVAVLGRGLLRSRTTVPRRSGASSTGMDYLALGDGPRTLLFIPGGPGSEIPTGPMAGVMTRQHTPFVRAGYTVWIVTRRRSMPATHTVTDMADDHAQFIDELLGGHVDLVVGESYGGMIAQYLAARHPSRVGRVVLALAAATISDEGKDLDVRWATARGEGRHAQAGEVFLEYVVPGPGRAWLRRALGPVAGQLFARSAVPAQDLLVEARAEAAFDARDVLAHIQAPVLILCGEEDEFFSPAAVQETADLIPDATVRLYEGKNHVGAAMSGRIPTDVLAWIAADGADAADGAYEADETNTATPPS
ncbi:alpha/beta fold hydrolase [Ornithinimicrobium sp. W1679]|uniref:alpha/beta fold hydrolase n=1 Tax=Ornithinimicrobium sp. W1679 TaxID=3418770 RepID=UPI003CEB92C9